MQLRIWAEMIVTGLYENTDSPPTTSMFVRAGGATSAKKGMNCQHVVEVL